MFQKETVQKIKSHILCSITFFSKILPFTRKLQNLTEPDRPQMTIWPMRIACWIPNARNTHSECVILIDLSLQKWFPKVPQYYIIRTFPGLLILGCGAPFVFLKYFIKEYNPSMHWLIILFIMYLLICVILHSVRFSGLRIIILTIISRLWTLFILRNYLPCKLSVMYVKGTL